MITILAMLISVITIVAMVTAAPNHRPAYVMPMAALLPPPPDVPAATEYDIAALAIRPEILRDIEETR